MSAACIAVCADDFGMDPEINAAAIDLANMGCISGISCMVGAPNWRSGVPGLVHLDDRHVEVGLHLDLTEYPLDSRVRRPLRQWILRTNLSSRPVPGLRGEIEAQLDAFAQAFGRPPAFVDGHEHVHEFPHVRQLLVEALVDRRWSPWLRSTRRPAGLRSFKATVIESLGAEALTDLAVRHGLRQNRRFVGVYGFDVPDYLQPLRPWLSLMQSGDLLVCHPARGWPSPSPFPGARRQEYEVLAGPAFSNLLVEQGVRIVTLQVALALAATPLATA
jgi:predicted glycoside hydrolase/deacetylase ChbG (UPF0249 family)